MAENEVKFRPQSVKNEISEICPGQKCLFSVRFENFMHSEWREEKILKGSVGIKMRLRF